MPFSNGPRNRTLHRHSDSRMQLELTRHVRRNRWRCTRHPNRSGPLPLNPPELPEITQIHTPHLIHANSTKCTQPTRPRPNTSSLPSSYLDLLPSSHITTFSPLPSSSILLKSTHQSPRMPAMLKILTEIQPEMPFACPPGPFENKVRDNPGIPS